MTSHVASTIESCMKEHKVPLEVARVKIKEMIDETWKDFNEEWLNINNHQPKELLERIFKPDKNNGVYIPTRWRIHKLSCHQRHYKLVVCRACSDSIGHSLNSCEALWLRGCDYCIPCVHVLQTTDFVGAFSAYKCLFLATSHVSSLLTSLSAWFYLVTKLHVIISCYSTLLVILVRFALQGLCVGLG